MVGVKRVTLEKFCLLFWVIFTVLVLIVYKCKPNSPATNPQLFQPTIVKSLPGYPGDLPFKLETGYIGVGELEQVQLFYYFVESERDAEKDPLIIWLTGGPGCSGLTGLLLEIGPLIFNYAAYHSESEASLQLNPYSWTKVASIIFVDSPVGTGFSYATTSEAYQSDDILQSTHIHDFIRKWLMNHQTFIENPLFVCGDSYSGMIVPVVVQEILMGNEIEHSAKINLKGYILGNPMTNDDLKNARVTFAHRVSILSDELYEVAKSSCNGDYTNVYENSTECGMTTQAISKVFETVNTAHVLEPKCNYATPKPHKRSLGRNYNLNFYHKLKGAAHVGVTWCREKQYLVANDWANDKGVQEALRIRQGTIGEWTRCNNTLFTSQSSPYARNVQSSFAYHQNFTNTVIRALIYSGDQDMVVAYTDTLKWIRALEIPIDISWTPWFVDGQVAGYVTDYSNGIYRLTFTTIKGGGHTAPDYKPQECLTMVDRWLSMRNL